MSALARQRIRHAPGSKVNTCLPPLQIKVNRFFNLPAVLNEISSVRLTPWLLCVTGAVSPL